jgi:DUF1680 family protein
MRNTVWSFLLILTLVNSVEFSAQAVEPLEPITFQKIEVHGFWQDQFKRITEKWLPHCIEQMEAGGRGQELLNLVYAAQALKGQPHGEYTGRPWSDAYVYNTVEAICLALAIDPKGDSELTQAQAFLRHKIEEWIPIILAAQMESGYIHSFHTVNGHPHFSNISKHEFYVMGYFIELGVAHYRITQGRDLRLYNAASRCADHLCNIFGPAPKRTWKNGHAGLEYALCRLARLVNKVEGKHKGDKYKDLARHFLDHQHEIEPEVYNQSHRRAVEMENAAGHAVRATYFYTAMADIALLDNDREYLKAVDRIWANAIHRKHYITGGVGASDHGEAFADDFDLRNDGYCESCASCGMGFWADRMHRIHHKAHYHDVEERLLYNNVLGALELSGENFFYQNPLASDEARYPWHGCPCCVGNIPRTLLALKDLMYSTNASKDTLYLNHFMDSEVVIPQIGGTRLRVRQETQYPWHGKVTLTLYPDKSSNFAFKLRIPDRTESDLYTAVPDLQNQFKVRVNDKVLSVPIEQGYIVLQQSWNEGDKIELTLPMEVQRVYCEERAEANRGRVALIRGPLVYNIEGVDHDAATDDLILPADTKLSAVWKSNLLEGIMTIEGAAEVRGKGDKRTTKFLAIPNYVRLNRGGFSQVWITEDPDVCLQKK